MGPGRRVRGEATWVAARDAYLAGASAGEVCERHHIGLTALRDRAKREGWRRRDRADPAPDLQPDDPDDLDDLHPGALADAVMVERAWRMAARALGRGRLREAQGWTRLVADLRTAGETRRYVAIHAVNFTPDYEARLDAALAAVDRARRAAATPPPRTDSPDSPDSPDSSDSALEPDSAPEPDSADSPDSSDTTPSSPLVRRASMDPAPPAAAGEVHSVHSVHSVSSALASPPLNRAERRRRARLTAARPRDGPE